MPLNILINGAKGRMGRAVADAAKGMGLTIGAAVDLGDDLMSGLARCDVAIDFSSPAVTRSLLELAVARRKPLVLGTTGHAADEKTAVARARGAECRAFGPAISPSA